MSPRTFSGRECWVYRAHAPSELCGHHAELIEQALGGAEPEYLLYSPLRETDCGPFGLRGACGSHALALTRRSLIVSRDAHQTEATPSVRHIPLTHVMTLAIGEALTLGWLAVEFAEKDALATEVVFFQSSGIPHFRELVRRCLRRESPESSDARRADEWPDELAASPSYLAGQVAPLVDDWCGVELVNAPETWDHAGYGSQCLTASTLIALADCVVMLAESERPPRKGMLVFGVNVVCIPRCALERTAVRFPDDARASAHGLTFMLATGGVEYRLSRSLAISSDIARRMLTRLCSKDAPTRGAA